MGGGLGSTMKLADGCVATLAADVLRDNLLLRQLEGSDAESVLQPVDWFV